MSLNLSLLFVNITDNRYRVADRDIELAEMPFQVQIHYTAPSGMQAVRVISKKKPVTHDRKEALATMNVAMCAARATQRSSELAAKGMVKEAKLNSRAWRHTMAAHICSEKATATDQQQCVGFHFPFYSVFTALSLSYDVV